MSRCGAGAVESVAARPEEVAPYLATLCTRLSTCQEGVDAGQCRATMSEAIGDQLGRAVGAMNRRGRAQLDACFKTVECSEISGEIGACVQPLMGDLLWLPG